MKSADPRFVAMVEGAYYNKSMRELYSNLYNSELPNATSSVLKDDDVEDWKRFTKLVHELIWNSLHPGESIELIVN